MHIVSLRIQDLCCIAATSLELCTATAQVDGPVAPNVTVLLGANGAGKTTVLRAIALAVLAPALERGAGFVAQGLVRRVPRRRSAGHGSAAAIAPDVARVHVTLALHPQDQLDRATTAGGLRQQAMSATVERIGGDEELEWLRPADPLRARDLREVQLARDSSAFFIVGYGANRRVEADTRPPWEVVSSVRRQRHARIAGLFTDSHVLVPLSAWLPGYATRNPGRARQVTTLMNRLLPEGSRFELDATDAAGGVRFIMQGVVVPFAALCDGYRAYVGWIADLLYHVCMGAPSGHKLVDSHGVVLVDEVDLHLHPAWQRILLPTLAKALPHLQFIVTTHSPLVVGSLQARNIRLLEPQGAVGTACRALPDEVQGRTAEQLLLGPYFGLPSTRSTETADALDRLRQASQAGDPDAAADYLRWLASGAITP